MTAINYCVVNHFDKEIGDFYCNVLDHVIKKIQNDIDNSEFLLETKKINKQIDRLIFFVGPFYGNENMFDITIKLGKIRKTRSMTIDIITTKKINELLFTEEIDFLIIDLVYLFFVISIIKVIERYDLINILPFFLSKKRDILTHFINHSSYHLIDILCNKHLDRKKINKLLSKG
jgi:hypothetical protein